MVASNDFPVMKHEWVHGGRAARAALSGQEALYDAGLVTRFNGGDETAFGEIVARHRAKLFAVAFGVLKNRSDAEEIAQDALMRAHRGLASFRGESSLISWLHCIAVNLARNRYWYFHRRGRHTTFSLDCSYDDDRQGTCSDLVATDEAGPARQAVASEFLEIVAACMARLRPPQQKILNLRVARGATYDVIAEELGISVGTVKSRVARARQTLRLMLTQVCPEFGRGELPDKWFETFRSSDGIAVIRP